MPLIFDERTQPIFAIIVLMKWFKSNLGFIFILSILIFSLFLPFFAKGKIPLPADILLGAYHPWSDSYWENRETVYPYKNFELSDAVTFSYPYKKEIVDQLSQKKFPLWNQYIFSGTPLLADGQSGALYPLNIFLFLKNFNFSWSIFILLQPVLAAILCHLYLTSCGFSKEASVFGSIIFAFNSYLVNLMELGNIFHTALWIPLSLYALNESSKKPIKSILLLSLSLTMSSLAGFMQIFLYHLVLVGLFFLFQVKKNKISIITFIFSGVLFLGLSASQILLWLKLLPQTVRWQGIGLEHKVIEYLFSPKLLINSIVPDFFGNHVTRNWFGSRFSSNEFIFYCGCLSLLFLFFADRKKTLNKFFFLVFVFSLILTLNIPPTKMLFDLKIPIFSSLTPPRILSITVLCFSFLAAAGLEELTNLKVSLKNIIKTILFFYVVLTLSLLLLIPNQFRIISLRNTVLPTFCFLLVIFLIKLYTKYKNKIFIWLIILLNGLSLVYQAKKYNPFVSKQLIYPNTGSINFLKANIKGNEYVLSTHPEVFPVNTNMVYKIQTPNGYNSVHLTDYNHSLAERQSLLQTDTSFGRTIFFTRTDLKNLNDLGVRFVITKDNLQEEYLNLVYQEKQTKIYEVISKERKNIFAETKIRNDFWSSPKSFYVGLILSIISVFVWVILFVIYLMKLYYPRKIKSL